MMLSAGYFRIRNALPGPVWMYPISYISFHTYSIQASVSWLLEKLLLSSDSVEMVLMEANKCLIVAGSIRE